MCPVPRTNSDNQSQNEPTVPYQKLSREETRFINRYNSYDEFEETSAFQLSRVDVDISLKINRNLAANCRNISDEVFPGIHLGDR